jgi:cell shape-determining protein MreC
VIAEKAFLTGRFLKRKLQEYEALKAENKALKLELDNYSGDKSRNK